MSNEIEQLERALAEAQKKSLAWAERRHALPIGSSRARVTTANAEWARAAEHRDRCRDRLDAAKARPAQQQTTPAPVAVEHRALFVPAVGSKLTMAGQTYTVEYVGKCMIRLCGSRGGRADLVQNAKNPTAWAMIKGVREVGWFRQTETGFDLI
jgi:hypothetical protein